MAIQPIDLQTLFAHLHNVGKEQAVHKESLVLQQELQGSELAKEAHHRDESVNETDDLEDGTAKVKEENQEGASGKQKDHQHKGNQQEESPKKGIYEDPDIGKNIDISG
jgi:hypothetical protein